VRCSSSWLCVVEAEREQCTSAHKSSELEFVLPMAYKQAKSAYTFVRATG